jgi:DNA polymerase-3 subunit delta'
MEHNEDFEIAHLLENAHGVPFKVLDELSGNKFIHYQKWQNQLLNIAIHPMAINQTDNERQSLQVGFWHCVLGG